ncbi:MAG: RHS repeat protein, partial [bacterium]|nr:RHS repeat protein [bacterium]
DGPLPGTTLAILGNDQVFQETPSSNRVLDVDTFATYEPRNVRLTTRDGRIFELDLSEGVTKLEDLNGNHLSITPAGIIHSSGRGIAFERDAEGRIREIRDPKDDPMTYGYDSAGDLVSFTDREDHTTRFVYDDDHRLEDIEDPRGIRPVRNDYDDSGRLTSVTDAFGKIMSFDHDLEGRREVITNRLGHVRVLEYDTRGNVVRELDENQKVTQREYDSEDNLTKEIDPLLHETEYVYDANNDLRRIVNPELHVTQFTYNSRGQTLTITDPRGKVTENRYDDQGNLEYSKDPAGGETVYTYYPAGELETVTDAEQNLTAYVYDDFGNQTRVTDALGHVTDSTHDDNGNRKSETTTRTLPDGSTQTLVTTFIHDDLDRVTETIRADGTSTKTRYDSLGKVSETVDPRQRSTFFHYDFMGRLERTEYEDDTTEERIYDAEGGLTTQKDRGDRLTTFEYDPVGRQTLTTFPDLKYTINRYDDAGRLIEAENARRYVTKYAYDDAGRRTKITDARQGVFDFEYDPAGNQTAVVDANRHRTEFEYDDAGRRVRTILPDLTDRHVGYDLLGRRISETDPAEKTTQFRYDKLGRLVKVIDALLQETDYVYDELGNRTQQIDANDHVTRFEYDALGRNTKRILPGDGKFEVMTYYADGTLKSHIDFGGVTRTFEYDTNQRLTRRAYPDGTEVGFTYTPTGQRKTTTDSRGTTTYIYDKRDRLTEKLDPTGYRLNYAYDAQGNRESLTATVGAEVYATTYTYDELDRLETVTDSQTGVTTLGYDPNGNRKILEHPNGVTTGYVNDDLNRLTDLSTVGPADEVLASYHYTLGLAGNRTRIDEHDGTARHYDYDDLYRLILDRVTDGAGEQVYRRDFVYDPVGNRRTQTIDEGDGPSTITSTYDDRDRLLTAATASYGWNDNGNLSTKTDTTETTYGWDFENRLTSVTLADGTLVETTYDADGNRVRASVKPTGGGAATVVDYLVDTTGILSHVVAEVVGGSVQTRYTRADDQLIGLYRPGSGASRYYHADGLGSVRVLSDELGVITDRYSYTAFGELLELTGSDLNPYRFAGEAFDPNTGFSYNRARWLDLATGRFASVDPFGGSVRHPVTLHRYSYANGDPVQMSDPSGLFVGGIGIAAVIAGLALSTSLAQMAPSAPIAGLGNTGIFVQAHDVVAGRPGIRNACHLSIKIVPRNQQKWIAHPSKHFRIHPGSRVAFATLGAGPERPPAFGSLISEYNREYDVGKSKAFFEKIGHSVDEDKLITYIMGVDAIYPDDQEYVLRPKLGKPGYNSNSYVAGILLAAGLQPPSFMLLHPELFPGAAKPLPLAQPGGKP